MTLTKDDLGKISELFNQGFQQLVIPYVDSKINLLRDELKSEMGGLRAEMKAMRRDINNHVASIHARIDENTGTIGYYFEQCCSKQEYKGLKKRVNRLELAHA